MNGIGYCLEARSGQPAGVPLFIDFASQCGGSRGQVWRYTGTTGHLSSLGSCAGLAGRVSAGSPRLPRAQTPGGPLSADLDVPVSHPAGQPHPQHDRHPRRADRADVDVGVADRQGTGIHHHARPGHHDQ